MLLNIRMILQPFAKLLSGAFSITLIYTRPTPETGTSKLVKYPQCMVLARAVEITDCRDHRICTSWFYPLDTFHIRMQEMDRYKHQQWRSWAGYSVKDKK